MVVAVSTERYRAVCHPLMRRQAYYKYIIAVISLSVTIEFPRFLEMKLNKDNSQYWTTDLMENPDYVQFSSYWNDIIVTGLLPLILLCYMNLRVFIKIKVHTYALIRCGHGFTEVYFQSSTKNAYSKSSPGSNLLSEFPSSSHEITSTPSLTI